MTNPITTNEATDYDEQFEFSLRPQRLAQYIGQQQVKDNLHIFIEAARRREE
ncbi:MAG TPA: hypothetical protein VIR26_03275, partial [Metalysinibacillus sp.]